MNKNITEKVVYVGVDDKTLDLFEGQYPVPNGMAYNSYVILDEKITVMDGVDERAIDEWLDNVEKALDGKTPEYIVVQHLEPDHSAGVSSFLAKYPTAKMVANAQIFRMAGQFGIEVSEDRKVTVKEGDTLNIGSRELTFVMAPMVHWPEVMMTYDSSDKILFAADAFGKFGTLDTDEDWACEARRYYFNICGKFGPQVAAVLAKADALDIDIICSLHGPILTENLEYYINLYKIWSAYDVEAEGVFIVYASMHGNTAKAAELLKEELLALGCKKVAMHDLARDMFSEAIEDAFKYGKLVLASPTYETELMPIVSMFLHDLEHKNYQKRKVGFIQNGTWAPMSGKFMKAGFEKLNDISFCDTMVTLKSTVSEANKEEIKQLAKEILAD